MSRFSILSKYVFALTVLTSLAGCYEGYKKPNQGDAGGGNNKTGGGAGSKLYGFTVIDVVRPDDRALVSASCGRVPTSLATLRSQEIERRVQATVEYATNISDLTRTSTTFISTEDCQAFSALDRLAGTPIEENQIPKHLKGKPLLHIRLVVWPGDTSRNWPSQAIQQPEWTSIRKLGDLGFKRRLSVNHFAMIGAVEGYIWKWRLYTPDDLNFEASTVSNPSPTPEGIESVKQSIIKSSLDFAQWLQQRQPQ
jgi:hypothetical protein